MNFIVLSIGVLIFLLAVTGAIGQGILVVKLIGFKKARILNVVSSLIFIVISFFI